jgi:hypothetical protein
LDSGCVSAEERDALAKRVQAQKEAEAAQAATDQAVAPPEPKKESGNSLAAALDGYKSMQILARKLDRRRESVEKAKKRVAEREQELDKAKQELQKAKEFLDERELEEAAVSRDYLQMELAVKASPSSLLDGNPEAQAMDATGLVAFKVFADGLAAGEARDPPAFPEALQLVFRKYVAVFGYDKCMGTVPPVKSEAPTGATVSGPQLTVEPGLGPAVPCTDGGGAAAGSQPVPPLGGEGTKTSSPATPPLRPESKKQKIREDTLEAGTCGRATLPPAAGGVGLGRGLFGTAPVLTAARLADLPGGRETKTRSRSRSRESSHASSGSAPLPTELRGGEKPEHPDTIEVVAD